MTEFWPHADLRPGDILRHLNARTTTGTVASSGFAQAIANPAMAWEIEYRGIVLTSPAELRLWDRLAGLLGGRATAIYVPLVDEDQGSVDGTLSGAHAAGATTVAITRVGAPVEEGHHFTVGDGRLHRVIDVNSVVGDTYTCFVLPQLRAAYAGGAAVEMTMPVCKCRLATDREMAVPISRSTRLVFIDSLRFIEDPN